MLARRIFSHDQAVRSLQVINHLGAISALILSVVHFQFAWFFAGFLVYWFIGVFGINIGFHRLVSHRSFKTWPLIEKVLVLIGCLTTVGSPLAWTALHRSHHMNADTPSDPHSPHRLGNWRAWFGFWSKPVISTSVVRDLRRLSFYRWTHRHYFLILAIYCGLLAVIDPIFVLYFYCLPACLCLHSTSAVIVLAHRHGYQTHPVEDHSRNSWITNLITLGEGWHNNHHAFPARYAHGEKWWEFDPPARIIRWIKQ